MKKVLDKREGLAVRFLVSVQRVLGRRKGDCN